MVTRDTQLEEKLLEYLVSHNMKGFMACVTTNIFDKKTGSGKGFDAVSEAVKVASADLIDVSFSDPTDDSSHFLNALMAEIPSRISGHLDPVVGSVLLIPVSQLVHHYESTDNLEAISDLYERSDILAAWPSICPRLWRDIGVSFGIYPQMVLSIQDEIDGDNLCGSEIRIRKHINKYLERIRDLKTRCSISEFHEMFTDELIDLWDLVDPELYLSTFPGELYLVPGEPRRYKTSFSRKLAIACVKHYVNAFQNSKRASFAPTRSSISVPKRERVIDACIAGNLSLSSSRDQEIKFFWGLLRKSWLSAVVRSGQFNLFEIHDHIQSDETLLNQFFMELTDRNNVEAIAQLLVWNEPLRARQVYKKQLIDDPPMPMLLSTMGSCAGARIDVFGPLTDGAFVFPFDLIDARSVSPSAAFTVVIDQLAVIDVFDTFVNQLDSGSVVSVEFFYKAWCDVMLEKPMPAVVAVATDKQVFVLLIERMIKSCGVKDRTRVLRSVRTLFTRKDVMKIVPSVQFDTVVILAALFADDVFELSSNVTPFGGKMDAKIQPLLDLHKWVTPTCSFPETVKTHLNVVFCTFERQSNWEGFLRTSQIHYIASKVWLSLQLYYKLRGQEAMPSPPVVKISMRKYGTPGMIKPVVEDLLFIDFAEKQLEFQNILRESQDRLHAQLRMDLTNNRKHSSFADDGDDFPFDD